MGHTLRVFGTAAALIVAACYSGTFNAAAVSDKQPVNQPNLGNSAIAKAMAEVKKTQNNGNGNSQESPGKSNDARKNACTKVRASIANRTSNLQDAGFRHLEVIDKVHANLLSFADEQQLPLVESDESSITVAREAALTAIYNLGESEDALSCEDKNVGSMAATVRLDVQNVHETLKTYRESVNTSINHMKASLEQTREAN